MQAKSAAGAGAEDKVLGEMLRPHLPGQTVQGVEAAADDVAVGGVGQAEVRVALAEDTARNDQDAGLDGAGNKRRARPAGRLRPPAALQGTALHRHHSE